MYRPKWCRDGLGPFPKYNPALKTGRSFSPGSVSIYALVDPIDGTVRYVGKTTHTGFRLREHAAATTTNFGLRWWLESLQGCGGPKMVVLEQVAEHNWPTAERAWMALYGSLGEIYNWDSGDRKPARARQPRSKRRRGPQDNWHRHRHTESERLAQISKRQTSR